MKYRWFIEYFFVFIVSLYASYLWFKPVMWDLAWDSHNHNDVLKSIFFTTSEREYFLGNGVDLSGTIWVFDRVGKLFTGESSTFIPEIFAPFGYDWGKNEGFAWGDSLFALPLMLFIPTPGWYNLHILLTLTLGYFGCSLLYKTAGAPWILAIGLSMLSLNNDFVQQEIFRGRPTQVHFLFHVLFLISVLKVLGTHKKEVPNRKTSWIWATIGGISGAGMLMVYWFGGVAVGFSACIAIILMGWRKNVASKCLRFLWMAGLSIGIPLTLTWRVSKEFLLGNGEALFAEMSEKPAYMLDLGILSIPIQKFKHLQSLSDVESLFFEAKIPMALLGITLFYAFINPFGWRIRWGWMIALFIAIGIPLPPALIWDGGWIVNGHAFLQSVFPPLLRCGFPERMVVAPILFMCIVCALSSHSLLKNILHPLLRWTVTILISIPVLYHIPNSFPSHVETPTSHLSMNPILMQATKKWPGGIIHVPLIEGSDTAHIEQMYHKQPIMGGPGLDALISEEQEEYIKGNSFLSALDSLVRSRTSSLPSYDMKDLQQLHDDGFRLVYINTKRTKNPAQVFQNFFDNKGMFQNSGLLALPLPLPK
jgi:hypothetical protein